MIPNPYREIFNMLVENTFREEVDWKPTSRESTFIVHFTGFSLSMTYGKEILTDNNFVNFVIRDSEGMKVDSFEINQEEDEWQKTYNLFLKARQQALKIDKAIAVISDELKKAKKVGSPIDK